MTTRPATNFYFVTILVLLDRTAATGGTHVVGLKIEIRVISPAMDITPVLTQCVSEIHAVHMQYFAVPTIHSTSFNLSTKPMWGTTVGELLCTLSNILEYYIFH